MTALAGLRDVWVRLALLAALMAPAYFVAAASLTKFGVIDWRLGFGRLTLGYGPTLTLAVAGLALVGLGLALAIPPRRGRRIALAALLISGLALAGGAVLAAGARRAPPIHDITTNLADPPQFSQAVVDARAAVPGGNGLDLASARVPDNPRFGEAAGQLVVTLHRAAYGDLAGLSLDAPPDVAFARARAAAIAQGWRLTRVDTESLTIEAEVESFWFGFVDDVAVRVRAAPGGAVVDVRSTSRVGVSDLGANAKRIRAYLNRLKTEA